MRVLFVLLTLLAALPARGEEVVAALSQNRIAITTNFDGSEILVFGAIKRSAPIPEGPPLEVIVTIEGPLQVEVIRRKDRRLGIWVNVEANVIGHTPTYYSVASTAPLDQILPRPIDRLYSISIPARIIPSLQDDPARDALVRLREASGDYATREGAVEFAEQTLFRSTFSLPANLIEGDYTTRIFLVRNGEVIDHYSTAIPVRKVGLEQWLYRLAHEQALIYGILCIFVAMFAGWGAAELFRRFGR